ncbi:MAG: hypothetical protein R3F54_32155 [Alphaproteobacteria bacterium]
MPDGVEDRAEIVTAGGGERIDGVADHSHRAVAAFLLAAHGRRRAALLAGDDDAGFAVVIVAAIAAVDVDPFGIGAACSH